MDQVNKTLWGKVKLWFLTKWKWVIGLFAGALAIAIAFARRDSLHRKNFENAKQVSNKEKKIIDDSNKSLVSGIEKINKESLEELALIEEESKQSEKKLENKKKEFLEKNRDSDTLAADLAKEIGVKFVDSE